MRSIWLGNRTEFDFHGKVLENAVCLGDIDNDGEVELVVGSMTGMLSVFKGEELWQSLSGLGNIAAIGVGDVMNCGSNAVIIITVDGVCYVYLCLNNAGEKLRVVHEQPLPPNTKFMVIGEALGNGQIYMVLGTTDSTVRLFKWLQNPSEASLACLHQTDCPAEIGSICIGKNEQGRTTIYVSQPCPNYMTIQYPRSEFSGEKPVVGIQSINTSITSNTISHLVASVSQNGINVITLLNGTVLYVEKDNDVKWSLDLELQLFKSAKVHVSPGRGAGDQQIVTTAWSGHTFIINSDGQVIQFELGLPLLAFAAGPYGPKGSTAFVYITFENKIILCRDVFIEDFILKDPLASLKNDPDLSAYTEDQLKKLTQYLLYDFPKRM